MSRPQALAMPDYYAVSDFDEHQHLPVIFSTVGEISFMYMISMSRTLIGSIE
jgi:hypothetical protein